MYSGYVKGYNKIVFSVLITLIYLETCEGFDPVWTTPSTSTTISISENTATAVSVYQLTATDADGDTITYSLSSGSGFSVIGDVVYTNTAYDYETTTSYPLQFSATDGVTPVTSPTLTVSITDYNDNTPTFSPAIYSKTIPEGSASGTSIAALTCTDADSGTNGDCGLSIQSGDDGSAKFTISGTTLQTTGTATDYESLSSQNYIYSLVVIATDTATAGSDLTGTAYVYVTITGTNDNTPAISGTTPSTISVAENSAVGTTVATIQATDADDGDDGVLTYSIIGGNSEARFGVGITTGEIYLTLALDYETTTSYSLTVQATDGGSPTDSATSVVTVTVTDVNDNTPACPSSTYTYSVAETSASGTTVTTLACTDADGDSITYSITSGNSESCFSMSAAALTTACTLDYDTGSQSYTLAIDASDGTTSSSVTVYISLTAENDNNPAFASNPTASLSESSSVGTAVTTYAAADSDASPHDIVSYSITAVTNSGSSLFAVDSTSGSITLASSLDYETTTSYVITVEAVDGGGTTATGSVTVSVTDVNDNSPIFSPSAYIVEIAESTSASAVVVTTTCADADTGDTVTYSIASGNSGSKFAVSGTGVISLAATIDYDTETTFYTLTVEATDSSTTATATVKITVTGTNEGTPTFASNPTVSLAESSSVSTAVTTYAATDTDASPHDITTYAITAVSNSGSAYFNIDATTGSITLAKTMDYDTTTSYEITVTATDGGGLVGTGTVTLSVTNVNDNTPACPSSSYTFTLAETSASGTTVTTLACTDGDTGASLAYTITSGNGDSCFSLGSATGILITSCTLDYDTGSQSYSLAVEVSDGTLSSTATVDVVLTAENDNNPTFASNPTVSLAESTSVGTAVTTYTASDDDLSPHDVVSYAISAVTNSGTSVFSIDSTSGSITLSSSLDYETTTSYVITVVATDGGGTTVTGSVTVSVTDVNDNSPIFSPSAYTVEIAESTSASATVVTTTCADADAADTITYSIASGNSASKFAVSGTGEVTLAATIDYDTETTFYTLTVEATDSTTTATATVKITVTGTNEGTPTFASNPTVSLAESSSVSTAVTTYAATDTDASPHDITTYAITAVSNSGSAYFNIDANTGSITLAQTLDYDTTTSYEITVTATDGGGLVGTGTVTLSVTNVNDNTPACPSSSYTFTLAETSASGTTVTTLACTDGDTGASLAYTITSGNGDSCFSMASATGILTTSCTLDYDTGSQSYSLAVEVSDGTLSSTATVDVVLTAENDNNPTFASNPTVSLAESTSVGTAVTTYTASDSDLSPHDVASYAISAVTNSGTSVFSIDSTSGSITLSSSFDYETTTSYVITVVATDGGGTTVTGSVTVSVTDVNDNSPIFSPSAYTVEIAESTSASATVVTTTCADADAADTVTYSIASGNSGGKFAVSGTGEITLAATIDYDTETTFYTLTVEATDSTTTATATVKITVTGTNEGTPTFASNPTVSLAESSSVSTAVTTYAATDTDASPHDITTYAITAVTNSGSAYFNIDATTGSITLAKTLDYDTTTSYEITVTTTDGGGLVGTGTVTLSVTNVNDNTPACPSSSYTFTLAETSASGTTVTTLACSDGDTGASLAYTISSGNADACFSLGSATGILTTACTLDYDTGSQSYSLAVEVSDGTLSSTATVDVVLTAENDNNPTFASNPTVSLAESTSVGTAVTTYAASDSDLSPHEIASYTITTVTNSGSTVFSIDSTSGSITLSSSLDYETTTSYVITVVATDGGGTTVTGSVTVSVTDVNDNSPIFSPSAYDVEMAESTSAAATVVTMTCADADTGDTVSYSIVSGNSGGKFAVSASGEITLASTIDYDTETTFYTLAVEATDSTTTATATVKITVTGTNEGTPTFASNPTVSLAESSSVSTAVTTYAATDTDASPHDITTYAITAVTNTGSPYFSIDASTGSITLAQTLDYETTTSYEITVTATDGGSLVGTGTVTVSVTDVNDNIPICSPSAYSSTVSESSSTGTTVTTLACSDGDTGDTITYSVVSGNVGSDFRNFCSRSSDTSLDYDAGTQEYTILFGVSDGTTISTATVAVTVGAANEATPTFASNPSTTLAEDTGTGTAVTTYTAVDADASPHNIINYDITAVTNGGTNVFTIDETSGNIQLAQSLDYESTTSYELTVVATDGGGSTGTGTVTVAVTDVNDNTPICTPFAHVLTVLESTATSTAVISDLSCSDGDAGTTLTYTMTQNPDNKFGVTVSGSTASLVVSASLDYETTTFYNLQVTVKDGGSPELTATVTIDVNVGAVDEGTYALSAGEDTAVGSTLVTVTATDSVDTGDPISYAFVATYSMFELDTNAGTILLVTSMDYETATNHQLLVTAYDGTTYVTATVTITVNDVNEVAVFGSSTYTPTFAENQAIGTTLVQVAATDGDASTFGTIAYSISSGDGASYFTIDSSTGAITASVVIDYEANQYFSLIVQAVDGVPALTAQCLVQITMTDENDNTPTFNPTTYSVTLSEDSAVTTTVTTVSATDADSVSNNNNVFEFTSTSSVPFTVGTTTGIVTTNAVLDRETTASYEMVILATDKGATPLTGTSTITISLIDVNDNDPSISGTYDSTIDEDTAVNTVVFSITATDLDYQENSQLSYSINSGNTNTDFKIEVGTGIIQTVNALDRETTASYTLEVYVVDNGATPRTASVTCTVTIGDLNDNTPAWTAAPYTFTVDENVATGSNVGTIAATDADTGVNSAISYSIIGYWSGGSNPVTIDTSTGVITTSASLDRESVDTYVIWCRVQDSGTPVLSSDTNVTITINDLNDNDPTFASTTYTATVTENTSVGTSITTMSATDADTGVNAVIVYSFDTSTTAGARADIYMTIGSSTGLVEVKASIDREVDASFTVVVLAVDTGTTPRTGSTTLTVNVGDENDNSPIFSPTYYNSEVPYTGSCSPTILILTATDADEGANAQLYYYFTTSNSDFTLDSSTGEVTRSTTLSSGRIYTAYAYSHDGGSPQLQTSTSATMRIDAYTPSLVVISYYLGISKSTYESTESTFISQLDAVYQVTYSSASVKRWCIVESTGSSIIVHMYVLQDNTTDSISNIGSQKVFLSASSAQGFVATDTAGTPSSSVIGTSWDPYAIEKIVLYETTSADTSTPWIQTATGIAVTTVCVAIGVACITMTAIMIIKYLRARKTAAKAEAPRAEIEEPNNSKDNSNKSNKSWSDKPRPPPYSREGRREQAKTAAAASALTSKNPNKTAFVSEPGGDINSWQKNNDNDFIVTNRSFDGRAVDQASGQVYEYNTRTKERQWVKTRGGTPVKIDIGKTPDGLDI
ncbi:LOW QUALITY PROTEIN: protocadherin Fat 4-like [Pecten maximus]|uniref:LOW QUALITY PROTEIN: protocadherin Fat 4-like n=1 Tax=Pecten maximus TaxID=6579 RepID=UPI001458E7DA|nr:LOW QUALITY PROTEIN: protocadherin Fat 4-like [Pecten maximus]